MLRHCRFGMMLLATTCIFTQGCAIFSQDDTFRDMPSFYNPMDRISDLRHPELNTQEQLSEEIRKNPNDHIMLAVRGWTYAESRKFKLAEADMTKAISIIQRQTKRTKRSSAQLAEYYSRRGIVRRKLEKSQDAIDDFSVAILQDEKNWVPYFHRWQIYIETGNREAADKDRVIGLKLNRKVFENTYSTSGGII